MIGTLLTALAGFSWILESSMVSLLLFGESEYPTEEQDDQHS